MSKLARVIVASAFAGLEAAPRVSINGETIDVKLGEPIAIPAGAVGLLKDAGFTVEAAADADVADVEVTEPADGKVQSNGNGDGEGDDVFDAAAVIKNTVPNVLEQIVALTREQLDAVEAAENAMKSPRTGVLSAIAQARKAFEAE